MNWILWSRIAMSPNLSISSAVSRSEEFQDPIQGIFPQTLQPGTDQCPEKGTLGRALFG